MTSPAKLRRLLDLPGVADLELKALMKPRHADPDARAEFPDIDATAQAAFGLSVQAAEAIALPADWDGIEHLEGFDLTDAFAAEGWDVTDDRRKPLRMLAISPCRWPWRCAASPANCRSSPRTRRPSRGAPAWPPRPDAFANASPHRRALSSAFVGNTRAAAVAALAKWRAAVPSAVGGSISMGWLRCGGTG
jgi:hypothetical protein